MPRKKEGDQKDKFSSETAIVKHSSHLSEIPLQKFTARDVDLFFGVLYKMQGVGSNRVVIGFDELRRLLNYTETSNARMIKDLKEMSFKFSNINLIEQHDDLSFKIVIPFIDFEVNASEGTFAVGVHPEFAAAINELDGSPGKRYTLSDVVGIAKMKSVYSKQCLKMIYMYRTTYRAMDVWYTTMKGLRYALSIPESYKNNDVKKRVIEVIDKEFRESDMFELFEIKERKSEKKAKGRPGIEGYTFYFKFKQDASVNTHGEDGSLDEIECPKCGRSLKKIIKKDGDFFYGHKDWRLENAPCQFTVSASDALKYVRDVKESETEDEAENITTRDLNRYYEFVNEEEERALNERRSEIREKEPKIWALYEANEEASIEFINLVSKLRPISEEGRAEWERDKANNKAKKDALIEELREALMNAGYEEDYLERRYRCAVCKDTLPTKAGCAGAGKKELKKRLNG